MRRTASTDAGLTVVVLTRNEEKRIEQCINAIPPQFPVLVVDALSTDRTCDLALTCGATVVTNRWPGHRDQRNFAMEECGIETPWALFIDADEIFPKEFFEWFEREGRQSSDFDVAMIPCYLVYKGRKLLHAPGYPVYHSRLWRRGSARFVHDHLGGATAPKDARIKYLDIHYLHYFFDDGIANWMHKQVGYAARQVRFDLRVLSEELTDAAELTRRSSWSKRLRAGPLRIPLRFIYHYVVRGGFRDGRAGFEYALIYAWYEFTVWVMRRVGMSSAHGDGRS